jgi:hypothetical protein
MEGFGSFLVVGEAAMTFAVVDVKARQRGCTVDKIPHSGRNSISDYIIDLINSL